MNILLFSVSIGHGHDQVAHTISQEFLSSVPNCRVKVKNTLKMLNPILDKVLLESYMNIIKFYPKAWGALYDRTNTKESFIDINDISSTLFKGKLKKEIESFKPSVIICTHPFPTAIMASLKSKNKIDIPIVSVITDFNVHISYLNDFVDHYIIASENLKYDLIEYGIKEDRILPLGIPIRSIFNLPIDRQEVCDRLGLINKRTILVMGGGLGLGQISKVVLKMDEILENIQIIAVAGRNAKLEKTLKNLNLKNDFKVYGFVNNIHELMEISDCIISKPGGVTSAEILAKQKPLIIFSPLPGHEFENTEFLMNSGTALSTENIDKIPHLVKQLLNSEKRVLCIKEMAIEIAKPFATQSLKEMLLSKYDTRNAISKDNT